MTPRYEIAIAGCGPSGLAAALLLHRQGHRVRLFERFREPQPIGSGLILQPTGFAVLRQLGLAGELTARGSRIDRLFGLAVGRKSPVLDVRYAALKDGSFGVGTHRANLFDVLFKAVLAAGISVETGCDIAGVSSAPGGGAGLVDRQGRAIGPFDLVIDALGSRSPLLAHAARPARQRALAYGALWTNMPLAPGFDAHALEQRYRRASVMVGVLPIGKLEGGPPLASLFWSLKSQDYGRWRERGLSAWKADVLRCWPQTEPLLEAIEHPDQMLQAQYRHHTLPVPAGKGIAFIGDAAHSTSPQLGQGANMGLLDAAALDLALRESESIEAALQRYADLRRFHIRFYQAASLLFTPFYQSDSRLLPLIRDRVVPIMAKLPGCDRLQALLVSGLLGAAIERFGSVSVNREAEAA